MCLTSFTLEALGFNNYCPAANSVGKWASHSVRLCHISGVSLGRAVVGGRHKDTALHSLLLTTGCGEWLQRSSLWNALLHTSISGYLPFVIQCPALAMANKNKVSFHLKLPGIRQSSSLLDVGRLPHKAFIRVRFSLMLFITAKSTLKLHPTQVLGPKDYKVQKKKNPNKQTGLDNEL